jgi:hypothetical protein
MIENFKQRRIRESGGNDYVGETACKGRNIGAQPLEAVLTDDRHAVAFAQTEAVKREYGIADFGAELTPRDLVDLLAALHLDETPVAKLGNAVEKDCA